MDFGFESTLKHLLIFLRDNYGLQTFDANSKRLPSIELKLFDLKDQKKNRIPFLLPLIAILR